jgi:hypothetical protein
MLALAVLATQQAVAATYHVSPRGDEAHDGTIKDCIVGHAERPLRPAREGGYGVNYPNEFGEHMRLILLKDGYAIR